MKMCIFNQWAQKNKVGLISSLFIKWTSDVGLFNACNEMHIVVVAFFLEHNKPLPLWTIFFILGVVFEIFVAFRTNITWLFCEKYNYRLKIYTK